MLLFSPRDVGLIEKSLHFLSIQKPFAHYTILCFGIFCKFLGIFGIERVFLKGLVKLREIRNIEDLM